MAADQVYQNPTQRNTDAPLPYERIKHSDLLGTIRLLDDEHLLVLQPFGWHLDGRHIPNAAEHFSREGVCAEHHWTVVCDFGPYVAIVRTTTVHEELIAACKAVLACETNHDHNGHAYLMVPARSVYDLGAQIAAVVAKAEGK